MTKWWKEDNGNQPRKLGLATEKLLRTIATADTGEGVHFKWLPGDRFQLVGTNYRVSKRTFHPLYDEYMGDNPTNGPLVEETSASVGFYVKVTDAGRAWIKLRDEGQIPGMDKKVAKVATTPPSAERALASALETDRGLFQGAPELRPNEARLAASRARKTAQEFRDKAIESRSRGD